MCMFFFSSKSLLSIPFQQILCMHMFMGLSGQVDKSWVCVLFVGRRRGDMTAWYQSSGLQQWASMGQEDAVTEGRITFSVQQSSSKFQKLPKCLNSRKD